MGFPVGYTELIFPSIFLHILSFLGSIRNLISLVFRLAGLQGFLEEPDNNNNNNAWVESSSSRLLLPELQWSSPEMVLPVCKFSEWEVDAAEPPDSCAVCLHEFEAEDEITCLSNCNHIYHRPCLHRWISYHHSTCPLCRTPFLPLHPNNYHFQPPSSSSSSSQQQQQLLLTNS